jgi:uncharacterized repeat protein (TIGR02543 family)
MKKFFRVKSLAAMVLVGFSLIGFASVANAAPLVNATATSSSEVGITGTNATPITVTATSVSGAPANMFNVDLPQGWSFVSPAANCSNMTLTGFSASPFCQTINFSSTDGFATIQIASGTFTAGQTLAITFAASSINVSGTRNFNVTLADSQASGATVDTGIATLAGGVTQSTVTFNANEGTGVMADQVASATSPLTANVFSRSGHTFAGWNTAANGSGTAYADGASYDFTVNTTLYAQWTAVLANTGVDAGGYFGSATLLFILGAILIAFSAMSLNKTQ